MKKLISKTLISSSLCAGRSEIPVEQFPSFIQNVKSITVKENELIAVHCTHGCNRTGYMIIRYLVEYGDMSIDDAVSLFNSCRPPGVYKKDYLDSLFSQYGKINVLQPQKPKFIIPQDLKTYTMPPGYEIPLDSEVKSEGYNMGKPGDLLSMRFAHPILQALHKAAVHNRKRQGFLDLSLSRFRLRI